jgi:hypothetical protein
MYASQAQRQAPLSNLQEVSQKLRPRLPFLQRPLPPHRSRQVGQRPIRDLLSSNGCRRRNQRPQSRRPRRRIVKPDPTSEVATTTPSGSSTALDCSAGVPPTVAGACPELAEGASSPTHGAYRPLFHSQSHCRIDPRNPQRRQKARRCRNHRNKNRNHHKSQRIIVANPIEFTAQNPQHNER